MGTRALTTIKNSEGNTLVVLYRQSDGYQDCHGKELKDFLLSKEMVNGISDYSNNIANGIGCLAAQLVANIKTKAGLHYIYPEGVAKNWVDFHYTIYPASSADTPQIKIRVESYGEVLFDGLVSDYEAKDLTD